MTSKRRTKPARAARRASASPKKASPRKQTTPTEERLYERVADILEQARGQVARSVNTAMVNAYWFVGREIIEVEQHGRERASYGESVLMRLAERLQRRFGKGFSDSSLRRMRQFFLAFPAGSRIRAGALHESQSRAARSIRAGALHESGTEPIRSGSLNRSNGPSFPAALGWTHEFLDLREHPALHEREIEQAIIDRLESFLLEMGKGFCFVGRQVRLTIEGDHFYVDLVFYNRLLRCFVLVDLKLGKLTHQDLGQMLMYVNYYDHTQRVEHEAKTVGIVLCSEKNDTMVKITFPDNDQVLAATYKRYLPTEAELSAELSRERLEAERMLRLAAPADANTGTTTLGGKQ